jgi:hypothetical protein
LEASQGKEILMSNPTPAPVLGTTLLPSVLRTLVPIIYAMLVKWGVVEWFDLPSVLWENVITALVTTGFYILLRLAERYQSQIGWLLGYAQQPVYVKGEVLAVAKEPTPAAESVAPQEPTTTVSVETTEDPADLDKE